MGEKVLVFDKILERSSKTMEELEQLEKEIKCYRRNSEGDVDTSLEILSDVRSRFAKNLLVFLLEKNQEKTETLIEITTTYMKTLSTFALSEIAHRKLGEIKSELSSPFFFKDARREYRDITYELDDLDDEASSARGDFQNIMKKYESIIKRSRKLKGELTDEKNSGFISFLGKLLPWGIATVLSSYVITTEYLQIDLKVTLLVLVILAACVSVFLFFWNQIFFGLKGLVRSRFVVGLISIPCLLFFFIFLTGPQDLGTAYFFVYASVFWTIFAFIFYLPDLSKESRKIISERDVEKVRKRFFREERNGITIHGVFDYQEP